MLTRAFTHLHAERGCARPLLHFCPYVTFPAHPVSDPPIDLPRQHNASPPFTQVFVEEPDGSSTEMPLVAPSYRDLDSVENGLSAEQLLLLKEAAAETPSSIVLKVMHAVRKLDEPYPLHGCEVAIRYCSPSNRASRLSPQSFAQYLSEPWYQILTEWDQIELEECEELDEGSTQVSQDVLIKRDEDESWTLVNWQLSRHSGRWLMDELSIN